jgi:hypothetical protein
MVFAIWKLTLINIVLNTIPRKLHLQIQKKMEAYKMTHYFSLELSTQLLGIQ